MTLDIMTLSIVAHEAECHCIECYVFWSLPGLQSLARLQNFHH
jgi:hypothetical protein